MPTPGLSSLICERSAFLQVFIPAKYLIEGQDELFKQVETGGAPDWLEWKLPIHFKDQIGHL